MINLDMVGKLDKKKPEITIAGTGTAKEFNKFLKNYEKKSKIKFKYSPSGYGASDHSSFYTKEIPVLFFNTGAHQDYHTPEDDIEFLNFKGQKKISDLIYDVTYSLAESRDKLTFQEAGVKEGRRSSRGFKVTLGIMPSYGSTEQKGLKIDGVTKGKSADIGGMKKGDIITAIDGKEISNIYDYMERLGKLKHGQIINVDVNRNNKKVVLRIQLIE